MLFWISAVSSTVLCKSNANDNGRISCFVLMIYRRYIRETSRRLANIKMRYRYNLRVISPRYHCSKILLQQDIAKQNDISTLIGYVLMNASN